jgi:hypothetical protein
MIGLKKVKIKIWGKCEYGYENEVAMPYIAYTQDH